MEPYKCIQCNGVKAADGGEVSFCIEDNLPQDTYSTFERWAKARFLDQITLPKIHLLTVCGDCLKNSDGVYPKGCIKNIHIEAECASYICVGVHKWKILKNGDWVKI